MHRLPTFIAFIFSCGLLSAQPIAGLPDLSDSLGFILGQWEGQGYLITQSGKVYTDVQEHGVCKVDCRVIEMNGLATTTDAATGAMRVVHDAFGIIWYDTSADQIKMRAFKKDGWTESLIAVIDDKVIQWHLDIPTGYIRYTADYSNPGKWLEKGEYSRDGEEWTLIMEMELDRVE